MSNMASGEVGLPEVASGYFWRVRRWRGSYSYQIQLRRKLVGRLISFESRGAWSLFDRTDQVLSAASDALRRSEREMARRSERKTAGHLIVGDYPPKKFGVTS